MRKTNTAAKSHKATDLKKNLTHKASVPLAQDAAKYLLWEHCSTFEGLKTHAIREACRPCSMRGVYLRCTLSGPWPMYTLALSPILRVGRGIVYILPCHLPQQTLTLYYKTCLVDHRRGLSWPCSGHLAADTPDLPLGSLRHCTPCPGRSRRAAFPWCRGPSGRRIRACWRGEACSWRSRPSPSGPAWHFPPPCGGPGSHTWTERFRTYFTWTHKEADSRIQFAHSHDGI